MAKATALFGKNVQRKSAELPFLYRFNVNGKTYTGETLEHDLKKAEAFVKARKAEVLGQAKHHVALGLAPMTFGQACDIWQNERDRHNAKPRPEVVAWLLEQVGEKTLLQDIKAPLIIRVREARRDTERFCAVNGTRKIMDSTVNNTLHTFAAIMNYANLYHSAPIAPIRWGDLALDTGEHEIRVITKDELGAILGKLRPDLHDVIQFALSTAKRIDEILSLTWQQIDWDMAHPTMRLRTKGGKQAIDPLGATSLAILRRQLAHQGGAPAKTDRVFTFVARRTRDHIHRVTKQVIGTHVAGERYPLDYATLRVEFNKVVTELGIEGVTIHTLRHTAATWMLRGGVRIEDVSRTLGHASIAITLKHYAKVTNVEVAGALDVLGKIVGKVAAELQQTRSVPRLVAVSQA
jgi:integrase